MQMKYNIIYADPAWQYDNPKNNDPAMGGITYDTMPVEDIMALPVADLADKNCALFMWATMPKLKEAFQVIEAWGFRYTTCTFVWVKMNRNAGFIERVINKIKYTIIEGGFYSGLGHWTNGNAELCLFAKKGSPPRNKKNVKQLVFSPLGRHSAKPPEVRNRIVELMGDVPRIELFAREKAIGWDVWGNEVESDINLQNVGYSTYQKELQNHVLDYDLQKFL